eukprot:gene11461-13546_t
MQLPAGFPTGTYLRNGPNHPYYSDRGEDHYFDADGMIETESHVREKNAGRKLYDGVLVYNGYTLLGNLLKNLLRTGTTFKSTANTALLYFNGKLLALMEASLPVEL